MFGLSVLLFLGIWIAITLSTIKLGAKHSGKKGALLGFMLTMGGIVGYWVIEYIHIQRTVTKLCETEGGIKIYVTPEEWRQQIGEEEWRKLTTYNTYSGTQSIKRHYKIFDGKKYEANSKRNPRIIEYYYRDKNRINEFTQKFKMIYFDSKSNQVLIETTEFSVAAGHWASGGSYKEWINNIQSCRDTDLGLYELIKKYSNNSTGENK